MKINERNINDDECNVEGRRIKMIRGSLQPRVLAAIFLQRGNTRINAQINAFFFCKTHAYFAIILFPLIVSSSTPPFAYSCA